MDTLSSSLYSEIKNTTKLTLGNMIGTVTRHHLRHYVHKNVMDTS